MMHVLPALPGDAAIMDEALAAVEWVKEWTGAEAAFCCGGFVRDRLLGVEPKDIDVFVWVPEIPSLVPRRTAAGVLEPFRCYRVGTEYMWEGNARVRMVVEAGASFVPYPIQVVFLREKPAGIDEVIADLDIGLCQCGVVPTEAGWRTVVSSAFLDDWRLSRLTVCLPAMAEGERVSRTRKRLERLSRKFLGFTISDPRGLLA